MTLLKTFRILLLTAYHALKRVFPKYLKTVFGPWRGWFSPFHPYSELRIMDIRKFFLLVKFLVIMICPPLPLRRPAWLSFLPAFLFLKEARVIHVPAPQPGMAGDPKEHWFFINGIATNKTILKWNIAYLQQLFHRPLTVIHNPPDSLLYDLVESAAGKSGHYISHPARVGVEPIERALEDPGITRVVLLAHSQGTIIAANVLRKLQERADLEPLEKLEIYAFSNCSHEMRSLPHPSGPPGRQIPYIESFANQMDLVAGLGLLSPKKKELGIHIDGETFIREGWGHFFNEHYLIAFDQARSGKEGTKAFRHSRLFSYLSS